MRLFRRWDPDSPDNMDPQRIAQGMRRFYEPIRRYFRAQVRGLEHVPPGAALYVGNHSSGMITPDSFLLGGALYQRYGIEGVPYGLGHDLAVRAPIVRDIVIPIGAVRATHDNAKRLFARGKKVLVYPGGDLDNMRAFADRDRVVFGGRRGFMRLALQAEVPILPVVAAGSHATFLVLDDGQWLARLTGIAQRTRLKVMPITLSIPWGLTVGPLPFYLPWPTRILIEILPPMRFARYGEEAAADAAYVTACADEVHLTMQRALTRLAAERRRR